MIAYANEYTDHVYTALVKGNSAFNLKEITDGRKSGGLDKSRVEEKGRFLMALGTVDLGVAVGNAFPDGVPMPPYPGSRPAVAAGDGGFRKVWEEGVKARNFLIEQNLPLVKWQLEKMKVSSDVQSTRPRVWASESESESESESDGVESSDRPTSLFTRQCPPPPAHLSVHPRSPLRGVVPRGAPRVDPRRGEVRRFPQHQVLDVRAVLD